jgi:hypothetical protein
MYKDQLAAPTAEARKAILVQMQNLIYDKAVYDILYYDANTEAYRTDRFAGWQNQPSNGIPLFTYSTLGYTKLTDAKAAPSATPTPPATASGSPGASTTPGASATPGPSGSPVPVDAGSGSSNTPLIIGLVAVVVVIVAVVGVRSRSRKATDEDDE